MGQPKVVKSQSFTKLFDLLGADVALIAPEPGKAFATDYVGVVSTGKKISLFGYKFPFFTEVAAMKVQLRRKVVKEGAEEKVKVLEAVLEFPPLKKAPVIGGVRMAGWGDMHLFYCSDDNMPAGVKFMLFPPEAELKEWCKQKVSNPETEENIRAACERDPKKAYYLSDPEVAGADCTALEYLMIDKVIMEAGGKFPEIRASGRLNAHGTLVKLFKTFTTDISDELFASLKASADKGNADAKAALQRISEASKNDDVSALIQVIAEIFDGTTKYDK